MASLYGVAPVRIANAADTSSAGGGATWTVGLAEPTALPVDVDAAGVVVLGAGADG